MPIILKDLLFLSKLGLVGNLLKFKTDVTNLVYSIWKYNLLSEIKTDSVFK